MEGKKIKCNKFVSASKTILIFMKCFVLPTLYCVFSVFRSDEGTE